MATNHSAIIQPAGVTWATPCLALTSTGGDQLARGGQASRGVEVDPDEFAILVTYGREAVLNGLDGFAFF